MRKAGKPNTRTAATIMMKRRAHLFSVRLYHTRPWTEVQSVNVEAHPLYSLAVALTSSSILKKQAC